MRKRLKTLIEAWHDWSMHRRAFRATRTQYVRITGEHIGTTMAAQLIAKGTLDQLFLKLGKDLN